jgi:preprotein translocase subunit SecA
MDYLKEGIGLRAMAQRDPLVEYQREGFQLFGAMTEAIKEESVGFLFNLEVKVTPAEEGPTITAASAAQAATSAGAAAAGRRTSADDDVDALPAPSGTLMAKGLDGPDRSAPLQYTAPTVDGDAGAEVKLVGADGQSSGSASAGNGGAGAGNREDRRKADRQGRKKA